jgi:VCBS repeat-containing protein
LTLSASTAAVGVPTLLTATVSDAASHSVHLGTVTFYDGVRSLGSAQIVSGTSGVYPQGTANLKTASLSLGANHITAVFDGTKSDLASTSSAVTVTVTGKNPTTVALKGFVTGTDF